MTCGDGLRKRTLTWRMQGARRSILSALHYLLLLRFGIGVKYCNACRDALARKRAIMAGQPRKQEGIAPSSRRFRSLCVFGRADSCTLYKRTEYSTRRSCHDATLSNSSTLACRVRTPELVLQIICLDLDSTARRLMLHEHRTFSKESSAAAGLPNLSHSEGALKHFSSLEKILTSTRWACRHRG